jgi:hypothetical protein
MDTRKQRKISKKRDKIHNDPTNAYLRKAAKAEDKEIRRLEKTQTIRAYLESLRSTSVNCTMEEGQAERQYSSIEEYYSQYHEKLPCLDEVIDVLIEGLKEEPEKWLPLFSRVSLARKLFPVAKATDHSQESDSEEEDSDEGSESDGDKYLAPMEDYHCSPYQSENHITTLRIGEVCLGGMPTGKRKKGKARKQTKPKGHVAKLTGAPFMTRDRIIPNETRTILKWPYTFALTNAGFSYAGWSMHANDPYDVLTSVSTPPTIGLLTWGDFYTNFRVLRGKGTIEVINTQTYPLMFYVMQSTHDQTVTTGPSAMYKLEANAYTQHAMLGPTGSTSSKHVFKFNHRVTAVVGSEAPLTADNFMGLIDGSLRVADHTYLNLCIDTQSANLLTTGVYVHISYDHDVLLYGRNDVKA